MFQTIKYWSYQTVDRLVFTLDSWRVCKFLKSHVRTRFIHCHCRLSPQKSWIIIEAFFLKKDDFKKYAPSWRSQELTCSTQNYSKSTGALFTSTLFSATINYKKFQESTSSQVFLVLPCLLGTLLYSIILYLLVLSLCERTLSRRKCCLKVFKKHPPPSPPPQGESGCTECWSDASECRQVETLLHIRHDLKEHIL